jgi:hypothetical protein
MVFQRELVKGTISTGRGDEIELKLFWRIIWSNGNTDLMC